MNQFCVGPAQVYVAGRYIGIIDSVVGAFIPPPRRLLYLFPLGVVATVPYDDFARWYGGEAEIEVDFTEADGR